MHQESNDTVKLVIPKLQGETLNGEDKQNLDLMLTVRHQ